MFRAIHNPVPPETTALLIKSIVEGADWQLRHPSRPDALPFLHWRAGTTDEQWVEWNAHDDETWYQQVERNFGLNARPPPLSLSPGHESFALIAATPWECH